jgi:hypothetical protein
MVSKIELKKCFPLIKLIHKLPHDEKMLLLEFLDDRGCHALFSCVENALYNPDIPEKEREIIKKTLLPKKKLLQFIAHGKGTNAQKKKKLAQLGKGDINSVINAINPILEAVFPLVGIIKALKKNF